MLKVYGVKRSRVLRVLWCLEELGLPYELIELDLGRGDLKCPTYLKLNPLGKMPTLQEGDLVLFESAAICNYLAAKCPDKGLTPTDGSPARAEYDRWLFFIATELEQGLWNMSKHTFVLPEEKRLPQMLDLGREDFLHAANVIENALQGRNYLVENRFTVVDIFLGHTLRWAKLRDISLGTTLKGYLDRLESRPALTNALNKDGVPFQP